MKIQSFRGYKYYGVGKKGGGWGGGGCTVERGLNEFSRILVLKSLTISNNLRKQKRLWKKK